MIFFLVVAEISNVYILQSFKMSHLGISFSQIIIYWTLSPRISGCFTKLFSIQMWGKGGIRNIKMSLAELRIELPSGFLGHQASLFTSLLLVVQKPVLHRNTSLSSSQRSVENSAGTSWNSQHWDTWKRKWKEMKPGVRTRDWVDGDLKTSGCKWLTVLSQPSADAELNAQN